MNLQGLKTDKEIISNEDIKNENIEARLLLEAIYLKYGYDFRTYSMASLKRRINRRIKLDGLNNISELLHRVINDIDFFEKLLLDFSVNITEMFRDPTFYLALRTKVIPLLKSLPFLKIWHAGCSTGEEVYSMAILLKEEGIYDRTQIYATDFNELVLKEAREGILPIDKIRAYTYNYQKSGGKEAFSDYYRSIYKSAILDKSLKENILFSDHNLATDWVFGEMNLIFCRNVLIYFSKELQDRVFRLFKESLCNEGFLCLGSKESIRFSPLSNEFDDFVKEEKIYFKKGTTIE